MSKYGIAVDYKLHYEPHYGNEISGYADRPDDLVDETLLVTIFIRPYARDDEYWELSGYCDPVPVEYEGQTLDLFNSLATGEPYPEELIIEEFSKNEEGFRFVSKIRGNLSLVTSEPKRLRVQLDPDKLWGHLTYQLDRCRDSPRWQNEVAEMMAVFRALDPESAAAARNDLHNELRAFDRIARAGLAEPPPDIARCPQRRLWITLLVGWGNLTKIQVIELLEISESNFWRYSKSLTPIASSGGSAVVYSAPDLRRNFLRPLLQTRQSKKWATLLAKIADQLALEPEDIGDDIATYRSPLPCGSIGSLR